jgi:arsenate reductase
MYRVLLLCKQNSVLSPIAEGYFRKFAGSMTEVYSAGLEPEEKEPIVSKLLSDDGIELQQGKQHMISDLRHIDFDYIITFDDESEKASHHFEPRTIKYHYSYSDIFHDELTEEMKPDVFLKLRDRIRKDMKSFIRGHFQHANAG